MQTTRTYKHTGIISTILFHSAIIFLFLYFGLRTPLPLPAEEGILVNFGNNDQGFGNAEPLANDNPKEEEKKQAEVKPVVEDNENLTQDYEEAPVIKKKVEVKKKTEVKPVPVVKKTEYKPKVESKPVVVERKPDPRASYSPGKGTSKSTNQGISDGTGNQGSPDGSPDSKNYTGSGTGNSGISFNLDGRTNLALPFPEYKGQVEGTVVVEITVDKNGNVTKAVPGVKGSTTLDDGLKESARQAALLAKFNRKPDARAYQVGTIKYRFKLQ